MLNAAICLSSLSFFLYFVHYCASPLARLEFKRLDIERIGLLAIELELLGSIGLIIGMKCQPLLLLSSGGLALMMLIAMLVRIKQKAPLRTSLPALFFMALNAYIFIETIK